MVKTESAAPNFGAKLMDQLLCGNARPLGGGGPFGLRQEAVRATGKSALGGNQQHGIGCDGKSWGCLDGCLIVNLGLANAEQGLFISEVDFDVPALEISFNDFACGHGRVSADQKGGLAIQQLGTFAETVGEWCDDDELKSLMGSGGTPHYVLKAFEAQRVSEARMRKLDRFPRLGVVSTKLLGSRGRSTIA